MNKKCYSYDEETFRSDMEWPLEDAVDAFLDDNPDFVGETEIELFEGEADIKTIGQYLPPIAEYLTDRAFGDVDEAADFWCEKITAKEKEIQEIVSAALDNWANMTDNQPNFYGVKNVKPIAVKIKVDNSGEWDIVNV